MFKDISLNNHIKNSRTVRSEAFVISEWNMNFMDNIKVIGNYRYRPNLNEQDQYFFLNNSFDPLDSGLFYTGATDSDIVVDGGFESSLEATPTPTIFSSKKDKYKYLYSLEDCFGRFRPRSGINKLMFGVNTKYLNFSNSNMFNRPRYYMADVDDRFKYWTSYRTESEISENGFLNIERGISKRSGSGVFYIEDAAPFVVYNEPVPANRIVVKMQTNVGSESLGTFSTLSSNFQDPFFGTSNQTTPSRWRIQYLSTGIWQDAIVFEESSLRDDGSPIIGSDGYVEIAYSEGNWSLISNDLDESKFINNLNFSQIPDGSLLFIDGIRVVAETMNKNDATLDIIEISPRLAVNLSDITLNYAITKPASDLGNAGLPVGELLAATGSLNLFDNEEWFNPNNEDSIIRKFSIKNMQVKFFEKIIGVATEDDTLENYFVPIKTMYSESFPITSVSQRDVQINLRDLYFYFESITAPKLFIPNVSLSYAISLLLDSAGFSNYQYLRLPQEIDPVIPYFYVEPDVSLAEVLKDLAISSQSAMFFDEYNNFTVMSKGYLMPAETDRTTDRLLLGSDSETQLSDIVDVSEQTDEIFNDGIISYNNKYIQKTYGSLKQSYSLDKEKTWVYKPSLLWEVAGTETTKTINEESATQSSYTLSAIPLNSNLSSSIPVVSGNQITNNIIDLGEAIYWISRYNGYFYANGEIIKYDAVEFYIPGQGNVWVSSNREYQNYFSKLRFNGKIYPTGRIRIFAEPRYEVVAGLTRLANGPVVRHGRKQFGTSITDHYAGVSPEWLADSSVKAVLMNNSFLFGGNENFPELSVGPAGLGLDDFAKASYRSGVIKNFLNLSYAANSENYAPVQASALTFSGSATNKNALTYIYKKLDNRFKHFGTRMRIVGKNESSSESSQSPAGASELFAGIPLSANTLSSISGGSGGIAVLLNPETNNGYYFEIIALSEKDLDQYQNFNELFNVVFYKIVAGPSGEGIPVKLWSGISSISVDDGTMIGQSRIVAGESTTVYDLSVEYQDLNESRRFYLYINDNQIAVVDDLSPLPVYNNIALFTRSSSQCMFENVFAIGNNYSNNSSFEINTVVNNVFSNQPITTDSSLKKYAMSGIVQQSMLSNVDRFNDPKYNLYYEEFGTIMREVAYIRARYDKAFPALLAQVSPTFNKIKGYTVSGFRAGAYEAEMLVFNAMDTTLVLDETTGNYLRIQGVALTSDSSEEMSVDNYFQKIGSLSNSPEYYQDGAILSPEVARELYEQIRISRNDYGKNEFSLNAKYIQSEDAARDMMSWIVSKIMKPRKSIGLEIFPDPTIQLGDIVSINYKSPLGNAAVAGQQSRFVVYNITYSRTESGPQMTIYLSEI